HRAIDHPQPDGRLRPSACRAYPRLPRRSLALQRLAKSLPKASCEWPASEARPVSGWAVAHKCANRSQLFRDGDTSMWMPCAAFLRSTAPFKPESFLRVARHPPRTLSMSDLAILRLLTTRKRSQLR